MTVMPRTHQGTNAMTMVHETAAPSNTTWRNAPTQTLNAGGVKFAYRQLGPDTGVPVVLLTHLAAVLDNWDPRVIDGIAAKHRVIAFDNRGVGASSGSTPTTIKEMARDAVSFIRALGLDQVDLFGFSMGGMIAQVIARQQPQLVRKIILAGTGPAGGEGIDKVTRITYLDTARGLLTRQDPSSFCSSPGPRTGAAPARSSWHGWPNVRKTATRPSRCARSAPSSRPSTDGVSKSPPTSRASTSRCSC